MVYGDSSLHVKVLSFSILFPISPILVCHVFGNIPRQHATNQTLYIPLLSQFFAENIPIYFVFFVLVSIDYFIYIWYLSVYVLELSTFSRNLLYMERMSLWCQCVPLFCGRTDGMRFNIWVVQWWREYIFTWPSSSPVMTATYS